MSCQCIHKYIKQSQWYFTMNTLHRQNRKEERKLMVFKCISMPQGSHLWVRALAGGMGGSPMNWSLLHAKKEMVYQEKKKNGLENLCPCSSQLFFCTSSALNFAKSYCASTCGKPLTLSICSIPPAALIMFKSAQSLHLSGQDEWPNKIQKIWAILARGKFSTC